MAIEDDFSVAANGNIRYTGTTANYTVIALHRWLGDLMDDAQASGNDILDITDATSSERSTDNIITLKSPYNIDDTAAQHLYDGSIIQTNGDVIYDGIVVFASPGAYLNIIQNGKLATPNFWTTSLNADAANGISHRFMLKVRTAAADIDGRRIVGITREDGQTYSEFKVNGTARGNNVLALTFASDLNHTSGAATIRTWNTITNTEGYRLIDVDNNGLSENYYSEYVKNAFTMNQLYERTKWLSRRALVESTGVDTGSNFALGNGTITGQAQSFANGGNTQYLTRAHFRLRKSGSPTGSLTAKVYAHSGSFGISSVPTGGALATSQTFDVATLTTSYQEFELGFLTPFEMVASTNYVIAVEYSGGDGSNFVQVDGLASSGTHAGNRSENTGAWAAADVDDLNFKVFTSSKLYGIVGETFRGITHEIVADNPSGTPFSAVENITWTGGSGQLLARVFPASAAAQIDVVAAAATFTRDSGSFITDGFRPGMTVTFSGFGESGNNARKIISTVTAAVITVTSNSGLVNETGSGDELAKSGHMWFQLLTGVAPTDNQEINGTTSGATADVDVTITERTLSNPYIGVSTGSAIIGSYGLGITSGALSASDKLFDLTTTQRTPPNNVTFTVGGIISDEDRVLVGPESGGTLQLGQLTLNTTLSGASEVAVVVTTTIPSDTPVPGTIRVELNSGIYKRLTYTAFSGSTFTIDSSNFTGDNATAPKNVFISYIDKLATATSEAFTVVFASERSLFVRVRDGGTAGDEIPIKTFETTATLGSAGGSATAIRTSDA